MDFGWVLPLIASVLTSLLTVGAGLLVARRFNKLGGGEAQERLNNIREELDDAMTKKLKLMEDRLVVADAEYGRCKAKVLVMERIVKKLRAERVELRQEMHALHEEVRVLRVDRKGATDRATD
jgi:hypothetical protein